MKKSTTTRKAVASGAAPRTRASVAKKGAAAKPRGAKSTAKRPTRAAREAQPTEVRRAIFIDVENTSSQAALLDVLASLEIDRAIQSVQLTAVGNWRTIGQQIGRELAQLGARLVHSAPARGVRDWSDLWIAVAAGGWIATAAAGDVLEIVSNDRAFDAVGDAAADRGILYRRVPHKRGGAAPRSTASSAPARRPRGRRPRRSSTTTTAALGRTAASTASAAAHEASHEAPHGASGDQMTELVRQLADGRSSPWVNLDVLENTLKDQGFTRPPNSPRLVTRLRRMKEFEVDSHGRVRLAAES